MNVLRWGANMIQETSPAGLIFAGALLSLTSPPVRQRLRSAAITATRGVLVAASTVQGTAASMRKGMEDIVTEAKTPTDHSAVEERCTLLTASKNSGRRLAVMAATSAMAVREGFQSILEDAKNHHETMATDDSQSPVKEGSVSWEFTPSSTDRESGVEEKAGWRFTPAPAQIEQAAKVSLPKPESDADISPDSARKKRSRSKHSLSD